MTTFVTACVIVQVLQAVAGTALGPLVTAVGPCPRVQQQQPG